MSDHTTPTPDLATATRQQFASDNYAGMCPEAAHWFHTANASGHAPAYGDDDWTKRVSDRLRETFETKTYVLIEKWGKLGRITLGNQTFWNKRIQNYNGTWLALNAFATELR